MVRIPHHTQVARKSSSSLSPFVHELVLFGSAVKKVNSIILRFPNAMVSSACSFGSFVTNGENRTCRPMSQITAEVHGSCYVIVELVNLTGKKNVKVQINVWVKVFAVDVENFVAKVVDELQIVLSHKGYPCRATQAKGQDKEECNAVKLGNSHVLHFLVIKNVEMSVHSLSPCVLTSQRIIALGVSTSTRQQAFLARTYIVILQNELVACLFFRRLESKVEIDPL